MSAISSLANPLVKSLVALRKKKERKQTGLFIVEGIKEQKRAIIGGFECERWVVCEEILDQASREWIRSQNTRSEFTYVTEKVFSHLALRENSFGVLAVFKPKNAKLSDLKTSQSPLLVCLERVEKPGNLGAIVRTMACCGCDGLIILDPSVDAFSPNAVRASLGGVFTMPIISTDQGSLLQFCKDQDVRIYATADTNKSTSYTDKDYTKPTMFVLGDEHMGISLPWPGENIRIPMHSQMDSLNLSASGSVLLYEAVRQRGLSG